MLKISTIICQNCNKKRVKFKLDSLFVRHHKSTSMAKPPRKTKVFGLCPSGGAILLKSEPCPEEIRKVLVLFDVRL